MHPDITERSGSGATGAVFHLTGPQVTCCCGWVWPCRHWIKIQLQRPSHLPTPPDKLRILTGAVQPPNPEDAIRDNAIKICLAQQSEQLVPIYLVWNSDIFWIRSEGLIWTLGQALDLKNDSVSTHGYHFVYYTRRSSAARSCFSFWFSYG